MWKHFFDGEECGFFFFYVRFLFCISGLWGLVNNSGIATFGEVEFTSLDTYKETADVNLWGTIRVTKAFLPLIRHNKGKLLGLYYIIFHLQ